MTKPQKTLPGFERFWSAYAYKICRADAYKAWVKNKCEDIADEICAAIPAYDEFLSQNPWRHKAHASTWLNGNRWLDEYGPPKPAYTPHPNQRSGPVTYTTPAINHQSREEYLRAEIARSERTFR